HQTLDSEYLRLPEFSFAAARRRVHGCTQGTLVRHSNTTRRIAAVFDAVHEPREQSTLVLEKKSVQEMWCSVGGPIRASESGAKQATCLTEARSPSGG
ncbi:hypothetical protein CABS01_02999, partial [Colletotrichum abscissum]|uniref:uncharacterized protein n=1 Tax=Colletotrichum abscissum TaxID=1671311 RepID=UPI0027D50E76